MIHAVYIQRKDGDYDLVAAFNSSFADSGVLIPAIRHADADHEEIARRLCNNIVAEGRVAIIRQFPKLQDVLDRLSVENGIRYLTAGTDPAVIEEHYGDHPGDHQWKLDVDRQCNNLLDHAVYVEAGYATNAEQQLAHDLRGAVSRIAKETRLATETL